MTIEEVQIALDAPTAGSQERGRPLLAGMNICRVSTAGGSQLSWGVVSKSGKQAFRNYRRVNRRWVEQTEIGGQDALWDGELRTIVVLSNQQALAVQVTVTRTALPNGADQQFYSEQVAKLLAFRALGRL